MSIEFRSASRGDGPVACDLFRRSVYALGASSYPPEQLDAWVSRIDPERLERMMLSLYTIVATSGNRVVGFASLDAASAELEFLYVDPLYAGRGIGRSLSQAIDAEARRRGLTRVGVTASLNAAPIYLRLGYRHERRVEKTIDGVTLECHRMSKDT